MLLRKIFDGIEKRSGAKTALMHAVESHDLAQLKAALAAASEAQNAYTWLRKGVQKASKGVRKDTIQLFKTSARL